MQKIGSGNAVPRIFPPRSCATNGGSIVVTTPFCDFVGDCFGEGISSPPAFHIVNVSVVRRSPHRKGVPLALSGTAQGTGGAVQLVVEDSRRAKKALDEAKFRYQETTAEEYELPNKPGALAQYLEKLATKGGKKAVVVYAAEAEAKAEIAA